MFRLAIPIVLILSLAAIAGESRAEPMKVGVFAVDASPPVGSPLAYDPNKRVEYGAVKK